MSRRIFAEFAIDVSDDCDLMDVISKIKALIAGDNVERWELSEICDDDGPLVSNFLR